MPHATGRAAQGGLAPSGVSQVDLVEPVKVAVDSGAARGAEPAGAGPGVAEPGVAKSEGAEPGGAELERVKPGGAESGGAEPGGAEPERADRVAGATGPAAGGASGARATGGAAGAKAAGKAGPGGARTGGIGVVGGPAGVGASGGAGAAGPGGARTGGTGAARAGGAAGDGAVGAGVVATGGAAGAGAGGAAGVVAGDSRAEGSSAISAVSGGAARPRPYYVPLLQQIPGLPPSTERREPESRPASPESCLALPVRTDRCVPRPRPPPVHGTHSMTLRPSTAPQCVPLPSTPESSLLDGPDPESDSLRVASPTVTRFLATAVTDPSFQSTVASALVAELVDFVVACRLDYTTSLIAESESESVCPPSVEGECALGTDVLEDRQEELECFSLLYLISYPEGNPDAPDIPTPRSYAEAIEGPYSSQWHTAMDTEMASWKSTGTYVDKVPPPGANCEENKELLN
ncbi:unnamed protein product [Closterium sp. NIES-54]